MLGACDLGVFGLREDEIHWRHFAPSSVLAPSSDVLTEQGQVRQVVLNVLFLSEKHAS